VSAAGIFVQEVVYSAGLLGTLAFLTEINVCKTTFPLVIGRAKLKFDCYGGKKSGSGNDCLMQKRLLMEEPGITCKEI